MCTIARVVGVARYKTHNTFSARGGKKVAHHCHKPYCIQIDSIANHQVKL